MLGLSGVCKIAANSYILRQGFSQHFRRFTRVAARLLHKDRAELGRAASTESCASSSFGGLSEHPGLSTFISCCAQGDCREVSTFRGSSKQMCCRIGASSRVGTRSKLIVPSPLSRDFDPASVENLACDPSLMKSVPTRDPPNRRSRRATHRGNRSPPNVAWLAGRAGRWRRRAQSCPHRTAPSQSALRGRAARSARRGRRTGGGGPPGRTSRRRGYERRTVPRLWV